MKTFKTKAGTELPIMDIKGKDYLQVAPRIVWFREEHPKGRIVTEMLSFTDKLCVFKANITDEAWNVLASAHKAESPQGFGDYLEKAETGAIGRALALCGYGTQFTGGDLDEGERLADSPTVAAKHQEAPSYESENPAPQFGQQPTPSGYDVSSILKAKIGFGKKYKDSCWGDVPIEDLISFSDWLYGQAVAEGKPMSRPASNFLDTVIKLKEYYGVQNAPDNHEADVPFHGLRP